MAEFDARRLYALVNYCFSSLLCFCWLRDVALSLNAAVDIEDNALGLILYCGQDHCAVVDNAMARALVLTVTGAVVQATVLSLTASKVKIIVPSIGRHYGQDHCTVY